MAVIRFVTSYETVMAEMMMVVMTACDDDKQSKMMTDC